MPPAERALVLRAGLLLYKYRLALWVAPWPRLRSRLGGAPYPPGEPPLARPRSSPGAPTPHRIAWAVRATSRLVPRSTCLVRALAAQELCARHGHASTIRLGSGRGEDGGFIAHAWLEGSKGQGVLIGGDELERYVPFRNRRADS